MGCDLLLVFNTHGASVKSSLLMNHASTCGLILTPVLVICTVATYPIIKPLCGAIFVDGNTIVLAIVGGCLALVLGVFLIQKIGDD